MRIQPSKKNIYKWQGVLKKGVWKQPIPNVYTNAIKEINLRCKGMDMTLGQLNAHLMKALVSSPDKRALYPLKTTLLLAHVKHVGLDRNHLFKIVKKDKHYRRLVNHFTQLRDYEFVEPVIEKITDAITKEDCYDGVIRYLIFDKQLTRAEAWVTKINNLDVKGDSQVEIVKAYLDQNDRKSAKKLLNQIVDDYFRKQAEALIN